VIDERETLEIVNRMAWRRGLSDRYLASAVEAVVRRGYCKTPREAAEAAVERVATTARRLGHETGAENWL
jgi:hypothetical protein